MHRRIITFLFLLPLALLTSLPCFIKQDIKQLLGISVHASAQLEKSKINNNLCTYTSTQKKQSQKQQQLTHKQQQAVERFLPHSVLPTDILSYQRAGSDPITTSSIPLFLVYRKLII